MSASFHNFHSFRERKLLIEDAARMLERTRQIDERYGRTESSRSSTLGSIEQALEDTDLRVVVIGEFSRGKSTLLNSILGEDILPRANEQTTAINTFIHGVPEGEEPYLKILYKDGSSERLPWGSGTLEMWGTELDRENRDAREAVERIEAYSSHPLLRNKLVFVDTPGFEGILPHHEMIAKQAMDESHVALWIQATDQLGGNHREWSFLRESIVSNFSKFITVINKWDRVLDPEDPRAREADPFTYARDKMERVRENFCEQLEGYVEEETLETLTSERNLFGVSALWGLDEDEDRRSRSKVPQLAARIEQMCLKGEADQAMLATPIKKLLGVQRDIERTLQEELKNLEEITNLGDLEHRIERLEMEIEHLEMDFSQQTEDSRREHEYWASKRVEALRELVMPLKNLRSELDAHLSERFVRRQLEKGSSSIQLPDELKLKFEHRLQEVERDWRAHQDDTIEKLEELRAQYKESMQGTVQSINEQLDQMTTELPDFEVAAHIDLSDFEEHTSRRVELDTKLSRLKGEVASLEEQAESSRLEREALAQQMRSRERKIQALEQRRQAMGGVPSPVYRKERRTRKRGGLWGGIQNLIFGEEEYQVNVPDRSHIRRYREDARKLEERKESEEEAIQRIQAEALKKHKVEMSRERAQKRRERELKRIEREKRRAEEQFERAQEESIKDALKRLKVETTLRLDSIIKNLEQGHGEAIEDIFDTHLEQLKAQVRAQYSEPMQTKREMLGELHHDLQQGEQRLEQKRQTLRELLAGIEELIGDTQEVQLTIEDISLGAG